MVVPTGTLPVLRRNGQKPSCEPCRKSKYRCDHSKPTCSRCAARGIVDQCIYHPAPMKGLTMPKVKKPQKARASTNSVSTALSPTTVTVVGSTPSIAATSETQIGAHRGPSTVENYGYLGSTAYNAVFTDNETSLALEMGTDSEEDNDYGERLHEQLTAAHRADLQNNHRVREAVAVLKLVRHFPELEKMQTKSGSRATYYCSILSPWLKDCNDAIKRDIYDADRLKSETSIVQLAETLFENTQKAITLPPTIKLGQLLEYFSGPNIRWELLGYYFTVVGLCMNEMPSEDDTLAWNGKTEEAKQKLQYQFLQAGNWCIAFCNDVGCDNDCILMIMLENCIYASQVLGDAHYLVWRKVGDVSTAIFASGIHQQKHNDAPFWLREIRCRILGLAYATDKMLSVFVGRPPRISKRYCNIEFPVDLEYSELELEGPALEAARAGLDATGWHKDNLLGKHRASVFIRPFVINATIREDIIEFCLAPTQQDAREKALDLIRRNEEVYKAFPPTLQTDPEMWANNYKGPTEHVARLYMEHLYNEFMVRRAMVRQLREDPIGLLKLAHKLLRAVVEIRNIRGMFNDSVARMQWTVVLFGLPTAGVLALELLQLNSKGLCHSRITQDIAVFISYLKWVHVPGDGNYKLVEQARKTLQRILDKVMDGPKLNVAIPQQAHQDPHSAEYVTANNATAIDYGPYDFTWFDNEQLDFDFWSNLNAMEQLNDEQLPAISQA